MIESEHTCTFNEPVPMENRTPSACCCTWRTGFMGIHWAWAEVVHNRLKKSTTRNARNNRGDWLLFVIAIPKKKTESTKLHSFGLESQLERFFAYTLARMAGEE